MLTHNTSSSRTVVGPFKGLTYDPTTPAAQIVAYLAKFERTSFKRMALATPHQFSKSKFVFHSGMLEKILMQLTGSYEVLYLNGRSLHQYQTTYFDTDNLNLYRQPKISLLRNEQSQLHPKIKINYSRAILVNKSGKEKLTLDLDFTFEWQNEWISLPGLAFIESNHLTTTTPFMRAAHHLNIPTTEKSTYQLGINLLYPEV